MTFTPTVPAADIVTVQDELATDHDVVVAFETAHENVAVVRVAGRVHYQLAVYVGAWSLRHSAYPSVSAALALVPARRPHRVRRVRRTAIRGGAFRA